jgi:hypothetical protein
MKAFLISFLAGLVWLVWAGMEVCGVTSWSKSITAWFSDGFGEFVFFLLCLVFVWQTLAWFAGLFRRPNIRRGDLRPDGTTR